MNFFQLIGAYIVAYWNWFNDMTLETVGFFPLFIVGLIFCVLPLLIGIMKRRYMIAVLTCLATMFAFFLIPDGNILSPVWACLVLSVVQLPFAKAEKSEIDLSEL